MRIDALHYALIRELAKIPIIYLPGLPVKVSRHDYFAVFSIKCQLIEYVTATHGQTPWNASLKAAAARSVRSACRNADQSNPFQTPVKSFSNKAHSLARATFYSLAGPPAIQTHLHRTRVRVQPLDFGQADNIPGLLVECLRCVVNKAGLLDKMIHRKGR